MARRFLAACFGTGPLAWPSLQARQISDFVQHEAANKHGGGRKLPSTAVRSLLRFLVFSGERSPGLEAVALTPRQWPHDAIPQRLTAQEVERILALSAGVTPGEVRNRAILILLVRLGLRPVKWSTSVERTSTGMKHAWLSVPQKPTMSAFYLCRKTSVRP